MSRRRAAALGCVATVALADYVIKRHRPPWLLVGAFDHPAHVATAGLLVLNAGSRPRDWRAAFLAGSLLPDLDHVPLALRAVRPTLASPRPLSHCLAAVAPVAGLAAATGDSRLAAAAQGMLAHFARDVGMGTGVPLLWPATRRSFQVPYAAYAAACLLLGVRAIAGPGRQDAASDATLRPGL